MKIKKSLQNLIFLFDKAGIDALLVTDEKNVRYLTDFRGDDTQLIISKHGNFVITDFRYLEEIRSIEAIDKYFSIELRKKGFSEAVKSIAKKLRIKKLGFESRNLKYVSFCQLEDALSGIKLIPQKSMIEGLRIVKDPSELGLIRKAIEIAKSSYEEVLGYMAPGMSEKDIAARFDYIVKIKGASRNAFDTIVSFDENSSMPHAPLTDKLLSKKTRVLLDFGAIYQGYNSDLTRSFVLGKIVSPTYKKIYNIIETAQKKAIEIIRPGEEIKKIDLISRNYIINKGFGKFFGHALGHGVGLSVHEDPVISPRSNSRLKEGMVLTVEPGIYIPKWGGVRLEEMVLVTKKGCEVLTSGNN